MFRGFLQSTSNRDSARKKIHLDMPATWKNAAAARGSFTAGKASAQQKGTSKPARARRRSKSPMVGGSGGGAGHKKQRQDAPARSGLYSDSERQQSPIFQQGDDQDHVEMDDQVVVQDRSAFTPSLIRPDASATQTGKFLAQCTLLAACMIFAAHVQVQC